ncbi:MAG TPA: hypothetical protein VIR82_17990 [Bradyrhizobium sp.]|jgi:hypothetical protein
MDILWKTSSLSSACHDETRIDQKTRTSTALSDLCTVKPHGRLAGFAPALLLQATMKSRRQK